MKDLVVLEGGNIGISGKKESVNLLAIVGGASEHEIAVFQKCNWFKFGSVVLFLSVGSCLGLPSTVNMDVVSISEEEGSVSGSWDHRRPRSRCIPGRSA